MTDCLSTIVFCRMNIPPVKKVPISPGFLQTIPAWVCGTGQPSIICRKAKIKKAGWSSRKQAAKAIKLYYAGIDHTPVDKSQPDHQKIEALQICEDIGNYVSDQKNAPTDVCVGIEER